MSMEGGTCVCVCVAPPCFCLSRISLYFSNWFAFSANGSSFCSYSFSLLSPRHGGRVACVRETRESGAEYQPRCTKGCDHNGICFGERKGLRCQSVGDEGERQKRRGAEQYFRLLCVFASWREMVFWYDSRASTPESHHPRAGNTLWGRCPARPQVVRSLVIPFIWYVSDRAGKGALCPQGQFG